MYIPEILEGEARGRLRKLYHQIKATMHVPIVPYLFRTLAFYPSFLQYAVETSRPNLLSRAFEEAAGELRAVPPPDIPVPPLPPYVTHRDLRGAASLLPVFHYANAKELLLATAWYEALSERPVAGNGTSLNDGEFLPPGIPAAFPKPIPLVRVESASLHLQTLLKQIVDAQRTFGPASQYRALAQYPTFLTGAWQEIYPYLHEPWYQEQRRLLLARAGVLAHRLPYPLPLSPRRLRHVLSPREIASCIGLIAMFRDLLPNLILDIELMNGMMRQPPRRRFPFV